MLIIKADVDLDVHPSLLLIAVIVDQVASRDDPEVMTVITSGSERSRKHTTKIHHLHLAIDIGFVNRTASLKTIAKGTRDRIANQPVDIVVHEDSHIHLERETGPRYGISVAP